MVVVSGAGVRDAVAAEAVLAQVPRRLLTRLRVVWADTAYAVAHLLETVAEWGKCRLGMVTRPKGVEGWIHLAKRWVVGADVRLAAALAPLEPRL